MSSSSAANSLNSLSPREPPRKVANMASVAAIKKVNTAFLSNRFKGLPVDEPSEPIIPKVKIPPIVIKQMKFADLRSLLSQLDISDFITKFMSEGIKVQLSQLDTYDKLINHLQTKKIQYYTFSVKNKLPVKIILSQLPKLDVTEVKLEINKCCNPKNLNCEEVRLIDTKHSRYDEYALYILNFTRENFNMNNLRSITGLFHVKVHWSSYRKRSGPTQCSNCHSFGHGNNHCNIIQKCRLCSGLHNESVCVHLSAYQEGNFDSVKCVNCNGPHPANHISCPKRADFIGMRQRLSRKANPHLTRQTVVDALDLNNQHQYPPLRTQRTLQQQPQHHQRVLSDHHQYHQVGNYSQSQSESRPTPHAPSQSTSNHWHNQGDRIRSNNQHLPHTDTQNNDDLFSPNELIQLSQELIAGLSGCSNKAQQFDVITRLAVKFLYGSP